MMSGHHDYRSKRRANLHFITDELSHLGSVFFLSLRYSYLTQFTEDPRHDLWSRSNRVERLGDVSCYLWQTLVHPCRMPRWLAWAERSLFSLFARRLPRPARAAIQAADVIFIESGIAIVYLPLIRRLAPRAFICYIASDSLDAINQAQTIKAAFRTHAALLDGARLPSPLLRSDIPAPVQCHFIPHGIETECFAAIGPSPYLPGTRNAVAVGSMLFDPDFFRVAGPMFPQITFHVIGSGHKEPGPANVIYYSEMPFEQTLPFIKHADVAIAPYGAGVTPYLAHTSMKLTQYAYLGIPAVCPELVATTAGRFGYRLDEPASIHRAMDAALHCEDLVPQRALDWSEVVQRLIHPQDYPDTYLAA